MIQPGDRIPLSLQLGDADTGKFVLAYVRDADDNDLPGSPFDLAHVANGLYQNLEDAVMPAEGYATAQYVAYDDVGHTVVSEAAASDIFTLNSDLVKDDVIPLYLQTFDQDTALYPRAHVRDAQGNELPGSPVNLTHFTGGLYRNKTLLMPSTKFVIVQFLVYTDPGHTVLSEGQSESSQLFTYGQQGGAAGFQSLYIPASIVGTIDSDILPVNGLQDEIVRGSDRTLVCRLVRENDGDPYDLSDVQTAEFRFLNEDGSVLSLKSSDVGAPVQIVSAEAGKLSCNISAAQSALLMIAKPAQFFISLTGLQGTLLIDMPNQLQVKDSF